jgi:hypothetical protein
MDDRQLASAVRTAILFHAGEHTHGRRHGESTSPVLQVFWCGDNLDRQSMRPIGVNGQPRPVVIQDLFRGLGQQPCR